MNTWPSSNWSVDPVFTWIRLAQRVPVRISIDVPPAFTLVVGLTATVVPVGNLIRLASEAESRNASAL
jgi:multidrug resistance efflux pump